jgi:eukaryotic-like serine/threonine-protein kinase
MPSEKIGRFEILSEISRSGAACVYKATDTASGQTVALKVYNLDQTGVDRQKLLNALITEAESTRDLNHQNIVVLYGAGEIDGKFCASMEYIEGMSLAGMIAKGETFSIWDALDISRQVCNGLEHAHGRGIFHRRLQPANIVSQWDGTVKILGYGVSAMWLVDEVQNESTPEALAYMSPEQVSGGKVDVRSNLYSWGAVLYQMLTGHPAFEGADGAEVQRKVLGEMPAPASALNPKLHAGIAQFLEKALAKDPGLRHQTSREMLNELEACKEAPKAAVAPPKGAGAKVAAAKAPAANAAAKPAAPAANARPVAAKPAQPAPGRTKVTEFAVSAAPAAAPMPAARRAAAAAGAEGASVADPFATGLPSENPSGDFVTNCIKASVAALDEEVQAPPRAPRVAVDPFMADEGGDSPASSAPRSFSEIDELPPLKEVYVEPAHAPAPEPEPEAVAEPEVEQLAESPLAKIRKAQKKDDIKIKLPDLPKIDPKLVMYGVGGAIAVGVVAFAVIGIYVHFLKTEDTGATAPQAVQTQVAPQAPVQPETPAVTPPQETAPPETPAAAEPRIRARARTQKAQPELTPVVVPGQLVVNSTPEGAQIQLDGRFDDTWVTPVTLTGIAPGQHTISVTKQGFNGETRTLDVASASKSFLAFRLTVQGATVNLTSEPAGAQILMDGRDTGRTTPIALAVDSGQHNFLIRMQGYLEESTTVSLQAGQSFRFAPALKPLGNTEDIKTVGKFKKLFGGDAQAGMGRISIRTNPKGAQIAINQRLLDRPSPADFFLNPGSYVIDITATGCKPLRRVVTVEKGSKLQLDETLERE